MAEGYLKSKNLPNINVRSRGLSADGSPVSENSKKAMAEIGIDISAHISRQVTFADIAWADKIIYMSPSHRTVLSLYAAEDKLFMLGDGISDPYGRDLESYKKCRNEIFAAIDSLIEDGFFSQIVIETMKRHHIKDIARLEKICFSAPWSEEMILQSLSNGTKFFAATVDDRVVGYVGINCVLDEGYITNIAVFPDYRRKGVAKALINRIFSLAKDLSLAFVSLEVRQSNFPAISLYKNMGFTEEGRRKNFYSGPVEDALIMTKRFEY
jgi:ribosomal-protein-alanine N-acetyltransferase